MLFLKKMSRQLKVKEFTEASLVNVPNHPRKLTLEEVKFVVKMNVEELMELVQTVIPSDADPKKVLQEIVEVARLPAKKELKDDLDVIAEQVDAFVDIDYYNCNCACKAGMNCDAIFDEVHQANMNKRFPDGTFHRNHEGKVIKPDGWKEGDIRAIVEGWVNDGTWTTLSNL
jgi:predicted HAD superfamily Cof-like phosphohydrolase